MIVETAKLVIISETGKENKFLIQKIIDIDNELDLCTIPSVLNKTAINHRIIEVSRVLSRQLDGMKIYLRFVDKKHINENMYLINQKRTDKGEYLLGF